MTINNERQKSVKNLIIGGGISGLTLAYFLKDDYLILEKDGEYGGYCRTIKNDRFIWDYAGHFYHFKTDEFKRLFLSLVEPDQIITRTKITKIDYRGKLVDYPFQMNIHQLERDDFIDCLYDLYFKEEKESYNNFLDMLYGKFGGSIVEKFLRPYNEKLYAIDLTMLDQNAMGRFFPYADLAAIIKNMKEQKNSSYNEHFLYLKQGTQYFIDRIYEQLDDSKIQLNCAVTEINTQDKYVITNTDEKIYYENLINTIPLNRFLKELDASEPLLEEMSYNKVLVLNIGFDSLPKGYRDEHWIYYPDKSLNFYRIGFYNNILGTDKLNVYVEIGYPKDADVDVKSELETTLKNMEKVGIIDKGMGMLDHSFVIMDPAYVHISGKTDAKIQEKIQELASKNIFTLGRYGKWTYCSMEDCMVWSKELSEKLS
jgi:protoporphyrinogen oxidase